MALKIRVRAFLIASGLPPAIEYCMPPTTIIITTIGVTKTAKKFKMLSMVSVAWQVSGSAPSTQVGLGRLVSAKATLVSERTIAKKYRAEAKDQKNRYQKKTATTVNSAWSKEHC